jgi:hypothetical protein
MFGQSFHWMDRDRVAAAVHGMLPPDGLFIQVDDLTPISTQQIRPYVDHVYMQVGATAARHP